MARRRNYFKRRHASRKMTLPIAVIAGFMPAAVGVWNRRSSATEMGNFLMQSFTGVTPGTNQFSIANMRTGLIPVAAGFVVHSLASKIGINRAIARARIPLLRI